MFRRCVRMANVKKSLPVSVSTHAILVSVVFLCLNLSLPASAQDQWTFEPSMPTPRWGLRAVAGLDGTIYAIGGSDDPTGGHVLGALEAYDAPSRTWTCLSPMPTPRGDVAIAVSCTSGECSDSDEDIETNGQRHRHGHGHARIFVFGGSNGVPLDTVEVYDPRTNSWRTAAPLPTARTGPAAVTGTDNRIYVIGGSLGGFDNERVTATVEAYNPSSNSWATVAPLPRPRSHLSAALGFDGRIYAIGGRDPARGYFLDDVTVYDPEENNWRTVASLPTARYSPAAAVAANGRIYVMGGVEGPITETSNRAEVYDPRHDQWATAPSMNTPREGLGAARGPNDRIYAIGGLNAQAGREVLNSVESYAPPQWTFTRIDVPNGSDTEALGINASGQIVGSYVDSNGRGHGFLLDNDTFTTIDPPGAVFTQAVGINGSGHIVGHYQDSSFADHGFLLDRGREEDRDTFITIDVPGAPATQALGINASGQIVGVYRDSSGTGHGFLLNRARKEEDRHTFITIDVPGATRTEAFGINSRGQIVGLYVAGSTFHGFLLDRGREEDRDTFTTIDVPGATSTEAFGINPAGHIVGFYDDSTGMGHGFLLAGGIFTTIDFPEATFSTSAVGINPAGEIVGQYIATNGTHGFVAR